MTPPQELVAGRYRLRAPLGEGGMGVVWLAHDNVLDRDVAVKEVVPPPAIGPRDKEILFQRVMREARVAARLKHPNIIPVFDVVEYDGRPWIVMEYLPSRSLATVIEQDGPLPPQDVAAIGGHLLAALKPAHAAGVLHRDVKPANVLLGEDGRVALTDFGIATVEGDSSLTMTGTIVGSPAYIAPERARGTAAGPASDLWSLGVTLYTAVEGHPPFQRSHPVATLAAVATDEPEPPVRAGPLTPILAALLRKDPAERLSATDAAKSLRAVSMQVGPAPATGASAPRAHLGSRTRILPVLPVPSAAPGVRPPVGARRTRGPAVLAALIVVLVVLGGGYLLGGGPERTGSAGERPRGRAVAVKAAPPKPAPTSRAPTTTIPAGYQWYQDRDGFGLAIPNGWTVERGSGKHVYVREPNGARFLLIDQSDTPKSDAVADWTRQEADRKDRYQDYQRIGIRHVPGYFLEAADWEFTYTRGEPLHVVSRGFVTSPHHAYGLYWSTPAAEWAASQQLFDVFTRTFRPRPENA